MASTDNVRTGILDVAGIATFRNNVNLLDDDILQFGDSQDLKIFHDGSQSIIQDAGTGQLRISGENTVAITNANGTESYGRFLKNGQVELFYDNTKRIETTNTGAVVTGILTATTGTFTTGITTSLRSNKISVGDDEFINVGLGSDLKIYHDPDGVYNEIKSSNGNIRIRNFDTNGARRAIYIQSEIVQIRSHTNNHAMISATAGAQIDLYYNNTKRLETTNTGITVTGTAVATSFTGDLTGDVTGTSTSAQGLTGSPNITVTNVNAVDAIISGNLSVAGTITSLDQNDILATGIITASSGVDLGDPGIVTLSSDTLTTTSTSADTVASVSATVNRSATFQVQVTRGTQYHMTTINVIHDGTNAFLSEYGTIRTGEILATFDADISGGNLRLRATPTSTASTVFKLSKTVIKV